ncbi:MAG: glycosyltransferase family 4 protein [Nanoarchaeota archaeon]|nr:glycosyltransferase family 4 protein [Nanoarchaeota archaeon]
MKVCILTTSFPAYKGHFYCQFIFKLTEALSKNKIDVDVVSPFYKESTKKEEKIDKVKVHRFQYLWPVSSQKLVGGGGIPHNLKRGWLAKLELIPFLFFFILKSLRCARKADIIHAQWILSGLIGVFIKKIYKKPLILSTRGVAVQMASKNKLMKPILRFVLRNCDYITPNNLHHISEIAKLGISTNKISTIPNGIDLKLYKPRDKLKLRKELGINKNTKIILFIGWLIERKGVDYLIKALPKIVEKNKNAILYLIGTGSLKKSIEETAKKLKIDKNLKILQHMPPEKTALWIAAADLFVLPSLSEGRPNVIYEAMLSETPVVATNIGGTNELIEDGKTGILVVPKDSGAISKKVTKLLQDKKMSANIAKKARSHLLSLDISWDASAKRFIDIYQKVKIK